MGNILLTTYGSPPYIRFMNCHFDISLRTALWFDARDKTRLKNGNFNFNNIYPRYRHIAIEEMFK